MNKQRKLLVLDIDHTLLHTVLFENGDEVAQYQELLMQEFPDACRFKGESKAIVVPRPYLREFTTFLDQNKSHLDIGIYSTGTAEYISNVLSSVFPWAIGNSQFIWDISYCQNTDGLLSKDLSQISNNMSYPLDQILMLDDSDVVQQKERWIPIKPFVATELKIARDDMELLRVIGEVERGLLAH